MLSEANTSYSHAAEKPKPFDFNLYLKSFGVFFSDFFGKKLPYFLNNPGAAIRGFPTWWGSLQQDERACYGFLALGKVMILAGIVLMILL